ncbi:MAG: WG repeat-containing protein [Anaerolineaceae bacterium]|nr:WG repeat-containing protein [Anaerolineaceae bacterium]
MKKSLVFILLIVSLFLFVMAAGAQTEVSKWETIASDLILNPYSEVIAVKGGRNPNYVLMDADGNKIGDTGFTNMDSVYGLPMFEFVDSSTGKGGVMDAEGNILLPAEYEWYDTLSEKWTVGLILDNSGTEKNYDMKYNNYTGSGEVYLILEQADFYFEGKKVGSLGHDEMKSLGKAAGNYVSVLNRSDEYVWYNSQFEKAPDESENTYEYRHTREDGFDVYYHQGSGQKAFMDGCTLNSDEVVDNYLYDDGAVYDLQGNLVFTAKHDYMEDPFHFTNGFEVFPLSLESLEVLIDEKGNEVIPPQYYDINPDTLESGYVLVTLKTEDNNRLIGWVKTNGEVSCEVEYKYEDYSVFGNFMRSKPDDDGLITIVSAEGELSGYYKKLFPCGLISAGVVNENDEMGVVDIFGNIVVPFSKDYKNIKLNNAGTIAAVQVDSNLYEIYHITLTK